MAANTSVPTKAQQDRTRAAIQTSRLVNRLQAFALGEPEPTNPDGAPAEIDALRMKAIEILLRKSLPDLQAISLSGDAENPVYVASPREKLKAFVDRSSKPG